MTRPSVSAVVGCSAGSPVLGRPSSTPSVSSRPTVTVPTVMRRRCGVGTGSRCRAATAAAKVASSTICTSRPRRFCVRAAVSSGAPATPSGASITTGIAPKMPCVTASATSAISPRRGVTAIGEPGMRHTTNSGAISMTQAVGDRCDCPSPRSPPSASCRRRMPGSSRCRAAECRMRATRASLHQPGHTSRRQPSGSPADTRTTHAHNSSTATGRSSMSTYLSSMPAIAAVTMSAGTG